MRDWFSETVGIKKPKAATVIWNEFNEFMADFDAERRTEDFKDKDIYEMPTSEFISYIKVWLQKNAT